MFPNLKFTIDNAEENIKGWKKLQDEKAEKEEKKNKDDDN